MEIVQYILLGLALSMDSLIIAMTSGAIIKQHSVSNIFKIAGMLATIQLILTVFGWIIGTRFANIIADYDHWIAFIILASLGTKVIYEGLKSGDFSKPFNPLRIEVMFSLALATSIDALAIGFSLSIVNNPVILPSVIIGITTFVVSSFGIIFGSKVGKRFNLKINMVGGIILIIIGTSILIDHVYTHPTQKNTEYQTVITLPTVQNG